MPTYTFTSPDGKKYKVSGQGSQEEAFAHLQSQIGALQEAPKPQNLFDKVGQSVEKRRAMGQESLDAYNKGEQGALSTAGQLLGNVGAGYINDVGGAIIGSVAEGAYNALPSPIQSGIKATGKAIAESPVGQGAKLVAEEYGKFEKENPVLGRNISALTNFATAVPVVQAGGMTASKGLQKAGGAIEQSADAAKAAKRYEGVKNLVAPAETAKNVENALSKNKVREVGLLRTRVIEPDKFDKETIETIKNLPVNPSRSSTYNQGIIRDELKSEAKKLAENIGKYKMKAKDSFVSSRLDEAKNNALENIYIIGDQSKEQTTNRIFDNAKRIINESDKTPLGLLNARKKFDKWVIDQRGKGVFDDTKETAVSTSLLEARKTINNMISEIVPEAGVKDSLKNQSNMYSALSNIDPKAAREAADSLQRTQRKFVTAQTAKNVIGAAIPLATAGYLAPSLVTTVAPLAGAGYLAYKGASNPAVRGAVGKTMSGAGRFAEEALGGINPNMAKSALATSAVNAATQGGQPIQPEQPIMPQPQTQQPAQDNFMSPADFLNMKQSQVQVQTQTPDISAPFLSRVAMAESGGDPNARAKTSSASGLYQFTDDTWNSVVDKFGKKYGITRAMKNDPNAQHAMVQELTADNARILQNKGIEPTDGNLYFAHFMGAPAASKAISKLGTGAVAARLFPSAASANKSIFFDKSGKPRTIEEVYNIVTSKVGGA